RTHARTRGLVCAALARSKARAQALKGNLTFQGIDMLDILKFIARRTQNCDAVVCAAHSAWVSMRAPRNAIPIPYWTNVPQPRVIRKYANRRLYDATASRHVTLEDIRRLIAGGEQVQVVDDRSGEDLTRSVLLQIIAEQEQFGAPVLSVQLLEGIIRFYGNPVQDMLARYLGQSLGAVMQQQRTVQAEMAKAMEAPLAP